VDKSRDASRRHYWSYTFGNWFGWFYIRTIVLSGNHYGDILGASGDRARFGGRQMGNAGWPHVVELHPNWSLETQVYARARIVLAVLPDDQFRHGNCDGFMANRIG
jgi:hypothetical protein